MPRASRVLAGLIAALALGVLVSRFGNARAVAATALLAPLGTLWVNAIRMTIVPLVVSLLFVGIASPGEAGGLARLGSRTALVFVALIAAAAAFAVLLVPGVTSRLPLAGSAAAALRAGASSSAGATHASIAQMPTFAQWVTALVPANVVEAAASGAMLPLIVFTLLFGLAAGHIDPRWRDALLGFFRAIADAMLTLVKWLIALAPLGVFALVLPAAARFGLFVAGALGLYVLAISAALLAFTACLYPIATLFGKTPLARFARAVLPAQAVALGSSSSLASLPALVEGARDELALPRRITGFVLPLSVATFKVATPITWGVGTLFIARLYDVHVASLAIGSVALASVLLSFSIPGVPQGALLLLAPMLASLGLPPEGVGLLIAADTIPDLVGTMANVTGDMTAAVILARFERVALLVFVCCAAAACGREQPHAAIGAGKAPAASRTSGTSPCPATGAWALCSVMDRLDRAGLAPRPDSARPGGEVHDPPLTQTGALVHLGRADLELFVYPDSVQRLQDEARLDRHKFIDASQEPTLAGERTIIRSANLLAILNSRSDHQRERVSDAITAGPPQP